MPCFTVRMNIQTKRLNPSPGKPSIRRHSPGLYRHQTPAELRQRPGLTGDNRGSNGKELPGRTGNNRLGTGNNRDCAGNNRDGTVRAPVYLCNVALKGLCRHSPGLHRGVAVPPRLFPVPRSSLPVLPGDSRFIPEVSNILILSRWSPGCPRSSTVHTGRTPVIPMPDHALGLRRHHIETGP
ncbi:hypothetical protein DPMN_155126 [Dreissena polymorpha]|uniref:Uncharacterized protein n=1 Tax=Dreissena polymorpha TaxID=45954 RepID=A0A9D4FMF2_DREPO|nr:hypothetical protein DPMN_155126 [Dreissena polymorpha]